MTAIDPQPAPSRIAHKAQFVIVFDGRTGSSYLVSLLNCFRRVLCYSEILTSVDHQTQRRALSDFVNGRPVESTISWAVAKQFFPRGLVDKRQLDAVGFKVQTVDIADPSELRDIIEFFDIKILHLVRRNVVKTVLSWYTAKRMVEQSQRWNAVDPAEIQGAIEVNVGDFRSWLYERVRQEQRTLQWLSSIRADKETYYYEDILRDRDASVAAMLRFLEVSYEPDELRNMQSVFLKNTSDQLDEAIANYEQLKVSLRDTEFYEFLD